MEYSVYTAHLNFIWSENVKKNEEDTAQYVNWYGKRFIQFKIYDLKEQFNFIKYCFSDFIWETACSPNCFWFKW